MDFNDIGQILQVLVIIGALTVPFYLYYRNKKVQKLIQRVLPLVPSALSAAADAFPDKKGVFDKHDLLVVLGRLTEMMQETITDPANTSFNDIQDELYEFVTTELERYREAGVTGVPHVSDGVVKTQINLIFRTIRRAALEDSAGDNS